MILLARFWCSCESKMVSKTDCNSTLHSTSPTLTKPLLGGDGVCHSVGMCFWLLLARSAPAHSEGKSPIMHLKLSRIRKSIIHNTERIRMKQNETKSTGRPSQNQSRCWNKQFLDHSWSSSKVIRETAFTFQNAVVAVEGCTRNYISHRCSKTSLN